MKSIISIIWRLHHTKRPEFNRLELGRKYEEIFRLICFNIIHVDKLEHNGCLVDGIMMTFHKSINTKHYYTIHAICIYGTIFQIHMKKDISKYCDDEVKDIFLCGNYNPVLIKNRNDFFKENIEITKRFFDTDVAAAMQRLRP